MTLSKQNQICHSGNALKSARASRKAKETYFELSVVLETVNLFTKTILESDSLSESNEFKLASLEYIESFENSIKHKGIVYSTNLYKVFWNWSKTDALGGRTSPIPFKKVDRSGVPLELSKLAKFWRRGGHWAVFALTLTSIHNTVTSGHPPVDLSSINGAKDLDDINLLNEFRKFVQDCNLTTHLKSIEQQGCQDIYSSGAQGVYAQSFYSASLERQIIKILPVYNHIVGLNTHFQRTWLNQLIDSNMDNSKIPVPESPFIRRLSVIPEKAHKHRIIVISDFWSQNALLPIHKQTMKMLRSISQDATYTSSEIIVRLSQDESSFRDCIDLKNFTDFLPISLQVIVLEELFGAKVANDWKSIMRQEVKNKHEFINYTRGQPMGLLSSWSVATLTHHYIMWWAGNRANLRSLNYYLLGDDNVILDERLSSSYTSLIETLGIPQSLPKRLTTIGSRGQEFCKRLIKGDKEITPIPWNVMSLGKVERYLDLYRLVNMRIDKLKSVEMFFSHCFPTPISELDRKALETYIELIRPSTSLYTRLSDLSPKSLNPSIQAKISKAAINLADVVDNVQEIIDYDPRKSNIKFTSLVSNKRIRNTVDPCMFIIYKIITLQYVIELEKDLREWEYRFKKIAGDGSIYVGGRINWNLANIKEKRETQFYKLEPAIRFSNKRTSVTHATLHHIKKFINRSTDLYPNTKGSLREIESDLGAFIYRKCLHESIVDLLKYKGNTISCGDLIKEVRKGILKIMPEISNTSVVPSLVKVEYHYDEDDEFGG